MVNQDNELRAYGCNSVKVVVTVVEPQGHCFCIPLPAVPAAEPLTLCKAVSQFGLAFGTLMFSQVQVLAMQTIET